jgi:ABC-2 type transport system permease protein
MSSNRSQILALRVIQQMLADRLSFLGILIRSEQSKLALAVVNQDEGVALAGNPFNLGDRLVEVLNSFDEFEIQILSADAAQDQLNAGEVEAVITLPPDFTRQVAQSHHLGLEVEFEGSNPMIADRLRTMLERVALQAANVAQAGSPQASAAATAGVELTTSIDATYRYGGPEYDTLDYMAPALVGFFVFFFTFLLTCIAFLRERVAGTLERLQATPIRAPEIIIGYMIGFLVFGLLQGAVTLLFTVFVLDIHYAGNLLNIFLVEALLVAVSVNLGIMLSTFAQNEFQVLQFIPLVVVSQGLLGGVIWQIEDMPRWLQPFSHIMPLTYSNRALRDVMIKGYSLVDVAGDLGVIVLFAVLVIALSSRTAGRAKI